MIRVALILAVLLLAACQPATQAPAPATAAAPPASAPSVMPMEKPAQRASASGVVQAVDGAAHTLTIAHGPVAALGWPAMTMTFQAPDVDLSQIKAGDQVDFDFTSTGMNGTITAVRKP